MSKKENGSRSEYIEEVLEHDDDSRVESGTEYLGDIIESDASLSDEIEDTSEYKIDSFEDVDSEI